MRILVQPFSEKSVGEFIIESLTGTHDDFNSFQAAVAFAKRSGVQHIEVQLKEFVGKGKIARIVVGVDLNGTTAEGLESLLDALGDNGELFVNHDENIFVAFHPKIYFFESDEVAILAVGSGNLTAGGLYSNDEAFAILELEKSNPDDQAIINQYKENFEKWCDEDSELVRKITDRDCIQSLIDAGYVPNETFVSIEADEDGAPEGEVPETEAKLQKLFGRMQGRKRAPRLRIKPKIIPRTQPSQPQMPPTQPPQVQSKPQAPTPGNLIFVMTLQRTDVGTGQTTAGTSRRSPEVFIPLVARDEEPDFWGWDNLFVDDPSKPGKKDRNDVKMRLAGDIISVNMFYNPVKKDLRLRSEALRSSGDIDDIIKIEKTDSSEEFDYYVEIIPKSSGDHPLLRAACSHKVKSPSKKSWGYYTTA